MRILSIHHSIPHHHVLFMRPRTSFIHDTAFQMNVL